MIDEGTAKERFGYYKQIMCLDKLWDIQLKFEEIKETSAEAYSRTNPTYYDAEVVLDLNKIKDQDHLKTTICHELLHCILSRLDICLENAKQSLSPESCNVIDHEFNTETERTIVHLERVLKIFDVI